MPQPHTSLVPSLLRLEYLFLFGPKQIKTLVSKKTLSASVRRSKNGRFWHASKSLPLPLPKTPFKTSVVVEDF